MTLAWILGRGGLLGGCMERTLAERGMILWTPSGDAFPWEQEEEHVARMVRNATKSFAQAVRETHADTWVICWAASGGIVGSTDETLRKEARLFGAFLQMLSDDLARESPHGVLFFSSSAGGVYGGCGREEISESTPPCPLSAYGRAKLEQEEILMTFSANHPHLSVVIGRISNLYGERQNLRKAQGLIAHLSGRILRHMPIHIYVPLDTIRDYVHAGDCSRAIAALLGQILEKKPWTPQRVLKIFASGRTTTVAEILGMFAHIAKTRPRFIHNPSAVTASQPRCLRFRSIVAPDLQPLLRHTPLIAGIHRVHEYQRCLLARGVLEPPHASLHR